MNIPMELIAALRAIRVSPEDAGFMADLLTALETGATEHMESGIRWADDRPGELWIAYLSHRRNLDAREAARREAAALTPEGVGSASRAALVFAAGLNTWAPHDVRCGDAVRAAARAEHYRRRKAEEERSAWARKWERRPQAVGHGDGGQHGGW